MIRDFKVSEPRIDKLHPSIALEVKELIEKAEKILPGNVAVRVVQGLRTFPEQQALYDQGRTKPGKRVTNAKAGQSFHNYGLAIDFALMYDKDGNGTFETLEWLNEKTEKHWMVVVDLFEEAGYTWGGRFHSIPDNPHLERTFGYTWKELLLKHNSSVFIKGGSYINLT